MKNVTINDLIKQCRETYSECEYLSDWQVQSSYITASSIEMVSLGNEQGPVYLPMPTGSGKTTGAIWGIVEFVKRFPYKKVCFLTPYKEAVDRVYQQLVGYLGKDVVGMYHSGSDVNKYLEVQKQVLVVTHAFIEYNHGKLNDRDLFVVDEAIYATGEAQLKLEHFGSIRSWATSNGVMTKEFEKLHDLVIDLDRKLRSSDKNYIAVPNDLDFSWSNKIAYELKFEDHSQTVDDRKLFSATQRFCEALTQGLVFLSRGSKATDKYDPVYSAAVMGIPRLDKTIIMSATGGMIYDIAGPFKKFSEIDQKWRSPSFENLSLVQLSGPKLQGYYSNWSTTQNKEKVVAYLDWLLKEVPEKEIYLTLPMKVLRGCLTEYFGLLRNTDVEYPIKLTKYGKSIKISHHARSIGTNEFNSCDAVIYLWDNHLPQSTSIQRFHTLENEAITDTSLASANSGRLIGDYKRIKEAQYIDNMMQQIGRGNVRNINENAVAGDMKAYILTDKADRFVSLAAQYKGCNIAQLLYPEIEMNKPKGRIARLVEFLSRQRSHVDIPAPEVEKQLGFELRRYSKELIDNWDIRQTGYVYVPGGRGRGKAAMFQWAG